VILLFGVAFELVWVEINLAEIAEAVALGFIVEMR
jgi:hypothetical protein